MDTEHICPSCKKPLPAGAPQGLCPECLMKAGFGTGVAPEPGQPTRTPNFVPPPQAEMARLFPQFEILELLGQGGMGAVYKARQPSLDRLVALKILPPQAGSDPGFADRFTREARALARLNHPNIVGVYEFGQADGLHYFVMEYVEGLNLRQLEQAGQLSSHEALKIIPQICDALQFAHDEGIVHRDIKPENVMLDKKGRVKITDFGLAKILGREPEAMRLTGAKDVMGTPHYMAPEQVEKPQTVDHRADIYSLGVVFYEMLTGELPLGKFAPPSRKVQVDVRLDEVVLHALEKEPDRRYQQASQVKSDVETIAASAGGAGVPPVLTSPELNPWQPAILVVGILIGWVLLLAGLRLPQEFNWLAYLFGSFALIISVLKLAGLWPFPSPIFPRSNFTRRHLPSRGLDDAPGQGKGPSIPVATATVILLLAVGAMLGLTMVLHRSSKPPQASAQVVVATETKLRQEIERRLAEAGWLVDGLSVNVAPDLRQAVCRFGHAWKINTHETSIDANILVKPRGGDLWLVEGYGQFAFLRFSVDTSAAVQAAQWEASMAGVPPPPAEASAAVTNLAAKEPPTAGVAPTEPPFAMAKPGQFKVALSNGVEFEVVAVASSPRSSQVWWRPDGTLLANAPGDKLAEVSGSCRSSRSRAEFAVLVKGAEKPLAEGEALLAFAPQLQSISGMDLYKEGVLQAKVSVLGWAAAPESLTCKLGLAAGPWERLATWDQAGTLLNNESGTDLALVRSSTKEETCLRLQHKIDTDRFALRLTARLKNGSYQTARICKTDYGGERRAVSCAILQGLLDTDVVAYELYRMPLRWAVIPGVATRPNVPPLRGRDPGE
jgi:serine/threonine protein kinase